jgi:hypothetical protein
VATSLTQRPRRRVSVTCSRLGPISRKLAIFSLLSLAVTPPLYAVPFDPSIISMFPKDAGAVEYADLSGSRQFSWFSQFEAQYVPACIAGFEKFLAAAHLQQTPTIEQVAWARVSISSSPAPGSGQLVAVAQGQFDTETIKLFLDSEKAGAIQAGADVLYESQTALGMSEGYFDLIDDQTIAFGSLEGLRRIAGIRAGTEGNLSGNPEMMALIKEASADSVFWGVLDSAEARTAVPNLAPELMKFPQANDRVAKLKALMFVVWVFDDIELELQADSASPGDAIALSQLLEASMVSQRFQSGKDNPAMAKFLEGMQVTPNGNRLGVSLNVTPDQMLTLMEHNTFSLLM